MPAWRRYRLVRALNIQQSAVMTFIGKLLTAVAHCACAIALLRWRGDDN